MRWSQRSAPFIAVILAVEASAAGVPTGMTVQGRLTDASGNPLPACAERTRRELAEAELRARMAQETNEIDNASEER